MASLKISSSLENFKILKFFKIWALRVRCAAIRIARLALNFIRVTFPKGPNLRNGQSTVGGPKWTKWTSSGQNAGWQKPPCFCPLPKRGRFDENGEKYEFAFYPLKTRVSPLIPPKTTKITKMAGVTQEKAWFRKKPGLFFPEKWTKMDHFGLVNAKIQFGIRPF